MTGLASDGTCGNGDDSNIAAAVVDGTGLYDFGERSDGSYCIDIDFASLPDGWILTTENDNVKVDLAAPTDQVVNFGFRRNIDFGDAPDTPYPTLEANNGARHIIPEWRSLTRGCRLTRGFRDLAHAGTSIGPTARKINR